MRRNEKVSLQEHRRENGPGSIKEPHEFSDHDFEARAVNKVVCFFSGMSSSRIAGTEKVENWI